VKCRQISPSCRIKPRRFILRSEKCRFTSSFSLSFKIKEELKCANSRSFVEFPSCKIICNYSCRGNDKGNNKISFENADCNKLKVRYFAFAVIKIIFLILIIKSRDLSRKPMNRKHFLLFAICMGCLFSCGKNNNNPTPVSSIVGTWHLQQQAVLLYQDSVKITDTTLAAAATAYGTAQFNADGTFSSSSVYFSGNSSSLTNPPPSTGKSSGKYSYSNNVFTISPGLAGWYTFVRGSTGPLSNISSSIAITQLTATHLTVHTDNKFTLPTSTGTYNFEIVLDNAYSK